MSIKTLLVPIRGDGKGEGVLDHAYAVASRFGAHIEAIHAQPRPEEYLPFGTLISGGMKETILQSAKANQQEEETRFRELFKDYCSKKALMIHETPPSPGNSVTASWREVHGKQAYVIGLRGRLSDLIVVPQPDQDTLLGKNTLEAALVETGRLVLMTPPKPAERVGAHIAVAWNGSAQSARAVSLAMDLLSDAVKVTILIAETGDTLPLGADDIVEFLRWHSVEPDVVSFKSSRNDIGGPLLSTASDVGADTLLMGAFGHNRNREFILGGVTQHVIAEASMPVLFAH